MLDENRRRNTVMAVTAQQAFGSYLRELRQRRGLSLLDVSRLSEVTAHRIDKGTLSRFESGGQRMPMAAAATLCRVYGVGADVLTERYELDCNVERFGAPDTEGADYETLHRRARETLLLDNEKWKAYALFRDAAERDHGDERTQLGSWINRATAARSLGFSQLALYEYEWVSRASQADDRVRCWMLERMACCHRGLGNHAQADQLTAEVLRAGEDVGDSRVVAYGHFSNSLISMEFGEHARALEQLRAGSAAWKRHLSDASTAQPPHFETSTLILVAEAYRTLGQREKAGRAARSAMNIARRAGMPRPVGFADLFLGDLEHDAGNEEKAQMHWNRAAEIGSKLANHRLEFSARVFQFRAALERNQTLTSRALQRKLDRLAPWVSRHSTAYKHYLELRP